mgnify:CR=1 FL=1
MHLRSSGRINYRLIWFDLETTGFNPFKNNIIEIAAIDNEGAQFETLTNNDGKHVTKRITEITNISTEMLVGKPTIESAMTDFIKFIKPKDKPVYLIGHNIKSFDLPFIRAHCKRFDLKLPKFYVLDTLRMSQLVLNEYRNNLQALCELFGIHNIHAHRAMSDAQATRRIYKYLCEFYRKAYGNSNPNFIRNKTDV